MKTSACGQLAPSRYHLPDWSSQAMHRPDTVVEQTFMKGISRIRRTWERWGEKDGDTDRLKKMKDGGWTSCPGFPAFGLNIHILENLAGSGKAEMLVTLQKRDQERGTENTDTERWCIHVLGLLQPSTPDLSNRHALSYGFAGQGPRLRYCLGWFILGRICSRLLYLASNRWLSLSCILMSSSLCACLSLSKFSLFVRTRVTLD